MRAFLTGSRVYGKPGKDSDWDLVVQADPDCKKKLHRAANIPLGQPLKFGCLNLIVCETEAEFAAWKVVTERIVRKVAKGSPPFPKKKAKKLFLKVLDSVGVGFKKVSGGEEK